MLRAHVLEQCATAALDHVLHFDESLFTPEPRVRYFIGAVRLRIEAAKQQDLAVMAGAVAGPLRVPQILAIHDYDVVEAFEVRGMNLPCAVLHLEAARLRRRHRACVRTVADVVRGRAGRVHVEPVIEARLSNDLAEHRLREWRTTDVAQAHEEYADAFTF